MLACTPASTFCSAVATVDTCVAATSSFSTSILSRSRVFCRRSCLFSDCSVAILAFSACNRAREIRSLPSSPTLLLPCCLAPLTLPPRCVACCFARLVCVPCLDVFALRGFCEASPSFAGSEAEGPGADSSGGGGGGGGGGGAGAISCASAAPPPTRRRLLGGTRHEKKEKALTRQDSSSSAVVRIGFISFRAL